MPDKNSFLTETFQRLCDKCSDGDNMSVLSEAERIFYVNQIFETEVNNGGFLQFFYNESGNYTNEILNSLQVIHAESVEKIYSKALKALGQPLPSNREERVELLNRIVTEDIEEILEQCDNAFYDYPDDLTELNYQYLKDCLPTK